VHINIEPGSEEKKRGRGVDFVFSRKKAVHAGDVSSFFSGRREEGKGEKGGKRGGRSRNLSRSGPGKGKKGDGDAPLGGEKKKGRGAGRSTDSGDKRKGRRLPFPPPLAAGKKNWRALRNRLRWWRFYFNNICQLERKKRQKEKEFGVLEKRGNGVRCKTPLSFSIL